MVNEAQKKKKSHQLVVDRGSEKRLVQSTCFMFWGRKEGGGRGSVGIQLPIDLDFLLVWKKVWSLTLT